MAVYFAPQPQLVPGPWGALGQGLQNLAPGLQQGLTGMALGRMGREDLLAMQQHQQQQQARQQYEQQLAAAQASQQQLAALPPEQAAGVTGAAYPAFTPQPQFPSLQSPLNIQAATQAQLGKAFQDPLQRELLKADIGLKQASAIEKLRPPSLTKSQLIARLGTKIEQGVATERDMALLNILNKPSMQVTVNTGDLQRAVGEQLQDFSQAQRDINQFKANPENRDLAKDFDIGVETSSKGILQLNVEGKKAPTSEQIKERKFGELLKSKIVQINDIVTKVREIPLTGPIAGRTRGALAEVIGGQSEFVKLKQLLDSLIMRVYMMSGKQVNETEMKLFKGMQPQANDPSDTFDTRLIGFYRELKDMSGISDALWNDLGLKTPSGADISTLERPKAQEQQQISSPETQADFDAIPSGTTFIDTDGIRKVKR